MASTEKSKKNRSKSSRNRPPATSTISQPSAYLPSLSSFSRRANLFAYLSVAVDKHRLSVFNTNTGKSLAEHVVQSARVSSLSWCTLDLAQKSQDSELPLKKKRRKSQVGEDAQKQLIEIVSLGLTNGSVVFFSPNHGEVVWTVVHPSSTASILSVVSGEEAGSIWTSGADGVVRLWNVHENDLLGSFKTDDRIPYSSMALRHSTDNGSAEMLVANHSIKLFPTDLKVSQKPKETSSFPGHASSVQILQWDKSQSPAKRFLSVAEGDRVISLWQVPENSIDGSMIASVQLDSDARTAAFLNSSAEKQTLFTLAASGKINVYSIPDELLPHKISSLVPQSTISPPVQDSSSNVPVISATFVEEEVGSVRVARLVGGARPVFDTIRYQDENGNFIPEITLDGVKHAIATETGSGPLNRRYGESSNVTVVSGVELGQDEEMDVLELENRDNALDVDLAELSLGQRLTATYGVDTLQEDDSADEGDVTQQPRKQKGKRTQKELSLVPAASLTRTLIQALHSSDSKLLETCLAHSDAALIRNTVRRLPPQLSVPLLAACVERLGRGARGGNMKGGGGGASSQRGTSLITWVKVVLSVHSGHMMTMPDLVARLSGLHSTLTSRLTLQESLLSLSGRLDMVLSQIEMRRSAGPSAYAMRKQPNTQKEEKRRYVEGESEEEDARMDVEVEVDSDEGGSIEDVELGGDSEESEEEEDDDEEEDEEDDDDDDEPTMNGFLDDEAEEEFTDEEDESD